MTTATSEATGDAAAAGRDADSTGAGGQEVLAAAQQAACDQLAELIGRAEACRAPPG